MFFFFFNDTATTEIYTLSLHDALPISQTHEGESGKTEMWVVLHADPDAELIYGFKSGVTRERFAQAIEAGERSEEHTSELQSRQYLVCRLLLEKNTGYNATALPSPQHL